MLHATIVGMWDKEADRFWVRNNLMFLVNGALLSVAGATSQPLPVRLITVAVGIFLAWAWLLINNKGGYYVSRWRPVIEALEQKMQGSPSFPVLPLTTVRPDSEVFLDYNLKDVWNVAKGAKSPRLDAGEIMHMVIVGFVLAWLGLGAFYVIDARKTPPAAVPAPSAISLVVSVAPENHPAVSMAPAVKRPQASGKAAPPTTMIAPGDRPAPAPQVRLRIRAPQDSGESK